MNFWVYTSKSLLVGAEADRLLPNLVAHWQDSNRAGLITGALIFTGSMFAQYIEGPEPAITSLRGAICVDERHVSIRTVDEGSTERRTFEQWTLAYSGHAAPFDRLVVKVHDGTPMVGRTLLLEMMRRFTSGV
jgi:hypothetical protein